MKLFALILLTLSIASLAAAQTTYTAYTVAGVQLVAPDTYTATVNDVNAPGSKAPIPANGSVIRFATTPCTHVPATDESAIVSDGPRGRSLLFSNGGTCAITKIWVKLPDAQK
jgi:hypothetical protein